MFKRFLLVLGTKLSNLYAALFLFYEPTVLPEQFSLRGTSWPYRCVSISFEQRQISAKDHNFP